MDYPLFLESAIKTSLTTFAVFLALFALQAHAVRCSNQVGDQASPSAESAGDEGHGSRWTVNPWLDGILPQADSPASWVPAIFSELKAVLLGFDAVFGSDNARTHEQQLAAVQNFRQQYPAVRRLLRETCDKFVHAAQQSREVGGVDRSSYLSKLQRMVKELFPSLEAIDQETPSHLVTLRSEIGLKTLERIIKSSDASDEIRTQRLVVQNLERYSRRLINLLLGMHLRGRLYDSVLPHDLDAILRSLVRPEPGYESGSQARREIIKGLGRSEIRAVSIRDGRAVDLVFLRAWNSNQPDQNDTMLNGLTRLSKSMDAIQKLGQGVRFEAIVYLRVFSGEQPRDVENRLRKTLGSFVTIIAL